MKRIKITLLISCDLVDAANRDVTPASCADIAKEAIEEYNGLRVDQAIGRWTSLDAGKTKGATK